MASIPASTRSSLTQKLAIRARESWPQIANVQVRFRGAHAYIDAHLVDESTIKLCRLGYVGYADIWRFAICRASHDDYQDSWLPDGSPSGTPAQALDTACGLYLADPAAWA